MSMPRQRWWAVPTLQFRALAFVCGSGLAVTWSL